MFGVTELKTLAFLVYMVIEQRLGKTVHGSVLGLANNVFSDIVNALSMTKKGDHGMNTELKAMVGFTFGMIKVGEDLIQKKGLTEMVPDLEKLGMLVVPVVSNYSTLLDEIKALPGSAQEADLMEFVISEFALVSGDPKAQAILAASLKMAGDMILDSVALASAIKG